MYSSQTPALPETDITAQFRAALAARQNIWIEVVPKVHPTTCEVVSAETQIRWRHCDGHLVAPEVLIAELEQSATDTIDRLTEFLAGEAARFIADSSRVGMHLRLAVNVSFRNFDSGCLPSMLSRVLDHYEVPSSSMELELTETAVAENEMRAMWQIRALRRAGFTLCIDDFGIGHAGLERLSKLKGLAHQVKISRELTKRLSEDPKVQVPVMEGIVRMVQNLGMKVTVDGVEDLGTASQLGQMGVDAIQGSFISAPMRLTEFIPWLASHPICHIAPELRQDPSDLDDGVAD